jgi:acyl-[acyl-carrier-protein]-phospholipid O-acyltransferase/long-chain-fatty-acid--[acyl-carrier-protein] ligase
MTDTSSYLISSRAFCPGWMRGLSRLFLRLAVRGGEQLPPGPLLLVSNHVSVFDPVHVLRAVERSLGHEAAASLRFFPVARFDHCNFPQAYEEARAHLGEGGLLCIFAEGTTPPAPRLVRFSAAVEHISHGLEVPIVPVAIDRRGSTSVRLRDRRRYGPGESNRRVDRRWGALARLRTKSLEWQFPASVRAQVTLSFGKPLPATVSAFRVRRAVQELLADSFASRKRRGDTLPLRFLRTARRHPRRLALQDHTGRKLRALDALASVLLLAGRLRPRLRDQARVGVLLPPSCGGALVNAALAFLGKTAVNLNPTLSRRDLDYCMEKAGVRSTIVSRASIQGQAWTTTQDCLFVEDLLTPASRWKRAATFLAALLAPVRLLSRFLPLARDPDAPAAVLFSSGSSGAPKAVVLSHFNIVSNIDGLSLAFQLGPRDRVVGVVPFFHALGYTATLWFPLAAGLGALYHPRPQDTHAVGALVREHGGTILVAPPTFFRWYLRELGPDDLCRLRFAVAGAEKLQPALAKAFEERFGLPLLEGYGATELSPVVSLNTHDRRLDEAREDDSLETGWKEGSIGHPIPGVAVKVVSLQSGEELDAEEEGLLCVKGPNVMLGYLDDPAATERAIRDGWYLTGDVGRVDEDGFLAISDRLDRFAKVAGEMVPHGRVEDELERVEPRARFAVTSVPDEARGERLVVVHTPLPEGRTAADLAADLRQRDFPRLWAPKAEDFVEVDQVPMLPSGKLDLRALRSIASRKSIVMPAV